jgi:hypothetical protein
VATSLTSSFLRWAPSSHHADCEFRAASTARETSAESEIAKLPTASPLAGLTIVVVTGPGCDDLPSIQFDA